MKSYQAILINAHDRNFSFVTVGDTNFVTEANTFIKSDCYCQGFNLGKGDHCLVDDEGLLKLTDETPFFYYESTHQPLAGNGLIIGSEPNGETTNVKIDIDEVKRKVTFYTLAEIRARFGINL